MGHVKAPHSPASNTSDSTPPSSSTDHEFTSFLLVSGNTKSHSPSIVGNDSSDKLPCEESSIPHRTSTRSRRSDQSGTHLRTRRVRSSDSAATSATQASVLDGQASGPGSHASAQLHALDPSRPAKDGMEWVWFPAGYWAERAMGDSSSRRGSSVSRKWFSRSPSRTNSTPARLSTTIEDIAPEKAERTRSQTQSTRRLTGGSDKVSSTGSDAESRLDKLRMGFRYMSPTYPHFISPSGDPEGMYCKTKRNVGSRFISRKKGSLNNPLSTPKNYLASQTTMVLEGASTYLERAQKGRIQSQVANSPFAASRSPCSPASPGLRARRFGLAPWHRRSSYESVFSVSSSVHNLLRGRTPLATPNSAGTYFSHDGRSFEKVEISSTNESEPTFLPSEARRVNTPPMSPQSAGKEARGFFFQMTPVPDDEKTAEVRNSAASTIGAGSNIASSPAPQLPQTPSREWWDAEMGFSSTPRKSGAKIRNAHGPPQISQFELNMPEHLPKSPLCPKNASDRAGGTGLCVYHGRRKSSEELNAEIGVSQE